MNSSDATFVLLCDDLDIVFHFETPESYSKINIAVIVINSFLLAFILIGNITVILAYFRNSTLQSLPNMLLVTLAFADLLVALIAQPLFMTIILMDIVGAEPVCSLAMLSNVTLKFCGGASLMTVSFVISPERYLAIYHPFKHRRWITKTKIKRAVFILWSFILILSVCFILGMSNNLYFLTLTVLIFIAIIVTTFACCSIVIKLKRRRERPVSFQRTDKRIRRHVSIRGNSADGETRDFKIAVTMFYIIGALVVCYVPLFAGFIYIQIIGSTNTLYLKCFYPIAVTFVLFNSFLNPVIYCLRNKKFTSAIRNINRSRRTDGNSCASGSYTVSLDLRPNMQIK